MVKVEQKDGGFVIEGKVLYGATVPHENYVNLAHEKWENLFYEKMPFQLIDFPGEYDVSGVFVKAMLGRWNKLSYVLKIDDQRIAILQTTDILDRDDIGDMNVWLYSNEKIAAKIEQLELEGKKVSLMDDE